MPINNHSCAAYIKQLLYAPHILSTYCMLRVFTFIFLVSQAGTSPHFTEGRGRQLSLSQTWRMVEADLHPGMWMAHPGS